MTALLGASMVPVIALLAAQEMTPPAQLDASCRLESPYVWHDDAGQPHKASFAVWHCDEVAK